MQNGLRWKRKFQEATQDLERDDDFKSNKISVLVLKNILLPPTPKQLTPKEMIFIKRASKQNTKSQ